jgi:hypothetical protein
MVDEQADKDCRYCNGSGWVLEPEDNTGNVGWFICRCVDKNNQCDDFIEDLIDSAGGLI